MSEFTCGHLFLSEQSGLVLPQAEQCGLPYRVKQLNDRWSAVFVPGFDQVPALSASAPVLYFANPEDYGWGFDLLVNGQSVTSLEVSWETGFNLARNNWDERFPDEDPFEQENYERWTSFLEEVESSPEALVTVAEQYGKVDAEAFQVFGLADKVIAELRELLTPAAQSFDQVERFKEVLGITEMSWMSYDSLCGEEA